MAPIALDHVEKVYSGGVKALDDLKLEVKEGLAREQTWSPTELMVGGSIDLMPGRAYAAVPSFAQRGRGPQQAARVRLPALARRLPGN
jgi:hypothetical protein